MLQIGEEIVGIDPGARSGRCNMLGNALIERGHEITWWSSTFHHFQKQYRCHHHDVRAAKPGLVVKLVHAKPGYRRNSSPYRLLNQRSVARRFQSLAQASDRPDLILACLPTLELCAAALKYGQRRGIPVIVDVRDVWPDLYLRIFPPVLWGLARLLLSSEFRRSAQVLREASVLTAVSESYLRWGLDRAGRPATPNDRVFHIGYTAAEITGAVSAAQTREFATRYGIAQTGTVVTFAGVFGSSYDLETIVECARLFQTRGRTDIQFVLAGGGDKTASLQRQAHGLGNLVFTGWLDQASLRILLKLSSIGLCAYSLNATQSLPNKPFEYMAAGLPQISSLRGELESLLHEHQIGLQYEAGSAESLFSRVSALADDPQTGDRMAARAKQVFDRHFDSNVIYPGFAAHLETVAEL